jgi:hypothetical protein
LRAEKQWQRRFSRAEKAYGKAAWARRWLWRVRTETLYEYGLDDYPQTRGASAVLLCMIEWRFNYAPEPPGRRQEIFRETNYTFGAHRLGWASVTDTGRDSHALALQKLAEQVHAEHPEISVQDILNLKKV